MKTITYNPETHVLVPREPSEEMLQAATADSCWEDMNPPPSVAYRSMLAAAPQPEPLGEPFSTILRENLDSLYEDDGKPPKPVESEPVCEVNRFHLRPSAEHWCKEVLLYSGSNPYDSPKNRVKLYTTPKPDRTAELEAALKVAREGIYKFLVAKNSTKFGCACDLSVGYLCGPCHADKQQQPLKNALAKINEVLK